MWEKVGRKGKATYCSLLYPLSMIKHNVPTQIFRQLVSLNMFIQLLQGTAHYHLFSLNIRPFKIITVNLPNAIHLRETDLPLKTGTMYLV